MQDIWQLTEIRSRFDDSRAHHFLLKLILASRSLLPLSCNLLLFILAQLGRSVSEWGNLLVSTNIYLHLYILPIVIMSVGMRMVIASGLLVHSLTIFRGKSTAVIISRILRLVLIIIEVLFCDYNIGQDGSQSKNTHLMFLTTPWSSGILVCTATIRFGRRLLGSQRILTKSRCAKCHVDLAFLIRCNVLLNSHEAKSLCSMHNLILLSFTAYNLTIIFFLLE